MNKFIQQIVNEILTEQTTAKNVVAIYPGRFQPMGAHHAKVFKWAQSKFGKNNTFISTSTKVERPKSPLSFSEKEMVIKKNGFNNIIQSNAMYNGEEYFKKLSKFKPTETALIMIVGEKDGERLSPKYYKKLSQSDDVSDLKPYLHTDENGKEAKLIYWMAAPHISLKVSGFGEMSGTTIRQALGQKSDNKEKLFKDIMGFYDKKIYDTIVPKFEELFESLYIPKEIIERWIKSKSKSKLNEISTSISPATAKMVDDGPNFYIPNHKIFMNVSAERAAKLGWEIVKQITSGEYEDYYEHPIYPGGPPQSVPDATTGNVSNDFDVDNAQEKWLDHTTRKMALIGWSVVKDNNTVDDIKTDNDIIQKSLPDDGVNEGAVEGGEPEAMYTPDGLQRRLNIGKPEYWFKQLGFTQVDVPTADWMRGRLKKDRDAVAQTRKVTYKVGNVKHSNLKDALKPVGVDQWIKVEPEPTTKKNKIKLPQNAMKENYMGYPSAAKYKEIEQSRKEMRAKLDNMAIGDQYYESVEIIPNSLNIPRSKMPQIKSTDVRDFIKFLKNKGIAVSSKPFLVNSIKMTQRDINKDKVKSLMQSDKSSLAKPVIISSDRYILDGHHRVLALYNIDKNFKLNTIYVDIPIEQLLTISHEYPKSFTKNIVENKNIHNRLKYYENYYKNLSPSDFKINSTDDTIVIELPKNNVVVADYVKSTNSTYTLEDITTGLLSSDVEDVEESLFGGNGGMKPYEKLLMSALVSFMKNTLNFSAKVTVKKKSSNSMFGDLTLSSSAMSGKITLHYNPNASYERMLKSLIHELIHAKQVVKGELKPSDDWKELVWKGKSIISVKDYNKFQQKDINQYKNLPWEKEAYGGMDKYYRMFLKSKEFNNLTDKDPNLDYIISNLSELHMGYTDQKWIDNQYNPIDEDITLDVNIGDTILMGKFKNKKTVVKSIGVDDHGMPTINGKKVVTFRKLKTESVLTEGGAAGHMMHLSDDLDLTFGELKKIVTDVLQGNIKTVTEKLDGQNLMVSWKSGKAIFARNKGHIKGFGASAMDALGVKQMFSGRGDLEEAFYTAAFDLQNAISKLSQKQRDKIFGEGSKWMNFEVMYPATTNVIPYNHTFLVFHGTVEYDESGNPIGSKGEDANILAGMLKQVNANLQSKYEIRGPVKLTITPTQDFSKSQSKYLSQIKKLQSEFGLKDGDKVGMYHYKYWETFIQKKSPTKLDDVTRNGLVLRWAYDDKSFRLDKNTLPDVKTLEWAKGIDKGDLVKLRGENMNRFDVIFLQLGAEVLKNMSGFLAANPDTAVQTLRKEMESAIPKLLASDDPKMIEFATRHLQRLEKMGGLDMIVPSEGIVFSHNGKIYKMTGAFAPMNMLLGAFKYGR